MFTPTLRCECAQPASDRLMRKWCIYFLKEVAFQEHLKCFKLTVFDVRRQFIPNFRSIT